MCWPMTVYVLDVFLIDYARVSGSPAEEESPRDLLFSYNPGTYVNPARTNRVLITWPGGTTSGKWFIPQPKWRCNSIRQLPANRNAQLSVLNNGRVHAKIESYVL